VVVNQFGNYLCQKIIELSDSVTLQAIINQFSEQLVFISLNVHGTRAIQTLIEKLAANIVSDQSLLYDESNQTKSVRFLNHCNLMSVINMLNSQIVELTMNMHGNHVLQSFLMIFRASNHPSDQDSEECDFGEMYT
jgi:hypothetical protein